MDWSDPTVRFGSRALDFALEAFCDASLKHIRHRSLELLDSLRACRVTLEYLRKVHSVDVVADQLLFKNTTPSVMTPLDDRATNKVKGYLRRRVEKLRLSLAEEYRQLVPQEKIGFEKGFNDFVETSMDHRTGFQDAWFQEHVSSGAAQPQLWKIYVAFQRQLRGACEERSKAPLPPPLFMKEDKHRRSVSQTLEEMESPMRRGHTQSCTDFASVQTHPYGFNGLASFPCIPYPDAGRGYLDTNGGWFLPKEYREPVLLPVCFQYPSPVMYTRNPYSGRH